MKSYRIGNTISVRWALALADGSPMAIDPEQSELYAVTAQHKIKVEDYTVEGNLLTWVFRGGDQKYHGTYTLTFVMNRGALEMVTVDCCNAFALVAWSCLAGGEDTPGVVTSAIDLYSTLPNRSFPVAVPSFDIVTTLNKKAAYVVGDKILVDKYPVLRFRNMAPKQRERYQVEIYRYTNRGRKRYQKRITVPLASLADYAEPRGEYGAVVLNVSLMRIFWEMWDAQGIGQGGYRFHNGGELQYDANAVASSWINWDPVADRAKIVKFNNLNSYRSKDYKSEVLISGKFALRLYDTENNIGGEMRLLSIRLVDANFVPKALNWDGVKYWSGISFSLRLK